ncbi:MAG: acetyl-CoA hydrolase [Halomonadaceae bacterium]|nr:MAG: acetyl-CoA hydrolase [Halomonadaceae bacterium]
MVQASAQSRGSSTQPPSRPQRLTQIDRCVDQIIEQVGKDICLGLPLGLGKAVHLANGLYDRACKDPSIQLHIVTALSLEAPKPGKSLEKRFLQPFLDRVYDGVPELHYARDTSLKQLPDNVRVSEFFFLAGSRLGDSYQQQQYICSNYTHAARDLLATGVNVVAQMVAPDPEGMGRLSLSCNPDLSLDLLPMLRASSLEQGTPLVIAVEVNDQLPWMGNTAALGEDQFDLIYDQPKHYHPLFSVPEMAIESADYLVGFYSSLLVKDAGTLQLGIGSLGSSVVYNLLFRHRNNGLYKELARNLGVLQKFPHAAETGGSDIFDRGLYGCSEMMMDGFLQLYNAGVLKRQVVADQPLQKLLDEGHFSGALDLGCLDILRDHGLISSPLRARDVRWLQQFGFLRPECVFKGGQLATESVSLAPDLDDKEAREALAEHALGNEVTGGVNMHGGFYLGPRAFYQGLRDLSPQDRERFSMTSVNYINHLYDHEQGNQALKQAQRSHARFINSAMMQTLGGAAVSDGLGDGRVVSGVGGQFNFVAMAHELPGARSIIGLKASRLSGGKAQSNIRFSYDHCTIPRHLRDIVVTEYGIADLRSKSDADVYQQLIQIADSRFQQELLSQAQKAGKVPRHWKVPPAFRNNTPATVEQALAPYRNHHRLFPPFPFSCEFSDEELVLGRALKRLQQATATRTGMVKTLWRALRHSDSGDSHKPLLARMELSSPQGWRQKLDRKLLLWSLGND